MMKRRTQAELEATAYHEAGHAIVAYVFKRPIQAVDIRRRKNMGGHLKSQGRKTGRRAWIEVAGVLLAGIEAEALYVFLWGTEKQKSAHTLPGTSDDVKKLARLWGKDLEREDDRREVQEKIDRLRPQIRATLSAPVLSCAWHAVAAELRKHWRLNGEQIRSVIERVEKAHRDVPHIIPGIVRRPID